VEKEHPSPERPSTEDEPRMRKIKDITEDEMCCWEVADAIRQGASFPELILVDTDEKSPLVVLEGHVRITAYFLRPEYMPSEMEVIVGFSKDMDKWSEY
jgi:hypothetical protein